LRVAALTLCRRGRFHTVFPANRYHKKSGGLTARFFHNE
jgi:hypothetical protein